MKKSFKRAGVAVLSMAMLLSMGAVAATSASAAGEKITVAADTGVTAAQYVKIYQVAKVGTDGNWAWDADVPADIKALAFTDVKEYSATATKELADKLANTYRDTTADYEGYVGTGIAVESDATAYYLVVTTPMTADQVVQPMLVQVTKGTVENSTVATAKTSELTFTKTIDSITKATSTADELIDTTKHKGIADAGATVVYKINTTIPEYSDTVKAGVLDGSIADADFDNFVITDIPEDSIEIDYDSVVVKVGGTTVDASAVTYTKAKVDAAGENGEGFTITLADKYVVDNMKKAVEVSFSATVTATPDVGTDPNKNTAKVNYSNNYYTGKGKVTITPAEPPTTPGDPTPPPTITETPDTPAEKTDEADVFCAVYTVNKVKSDTTALAGAEFTIYQGAKTDVVDTSTNLAKDTAVKVAKPVAAGTGANEFTFTGLGNGTYTIIETKVPDGYKRAEAIEVVVSDSTTDSFAGNFLYNGSTTNSTNVINLPGESLPGTGGIGTTLFTVGGAAIVLVAGFMFVMYMKKRGTEEE